jgi:uncharacterized membrane protein YqaE (UPF0057 family)
MLPRQLDGRVNWQRVINWILFAVAWLFTVIVSSWIAIQRCGR